MKLAINAQKPKPKPAPKKKNTIGGRSMVPKKNIELPD